MKAIPLYRESNGQKSVHVIRQILEISPQPAQGRAGGVDVGEMRKRCRVLDKLDAIGEDATTLLLEDDEHATLVRAINATSFNVSNASYLKILDGVLEAKEPAKAEAA